MTEDIGQLGDGILGVVVGTAILLNGETSHLVLGTQFAEFLASDFRIRATVAVIVGVVTVFVFVLIFVFVFVGEVVLAELAAEMSGGRRHVIHIDRIH